MNSLKAIQALILVTIFTSIPLVKASTDHKLKQQNPMLFSGAGSEPHAIVETFKKSLKTKNRSVAISSLHEQVTIFEGGKVERSASEYASHHLQADMNYISSVNVEILEHHVETIGEVAVSKARTKTTGSYKGKTIDRIGMETIILRKFNGSWKIIHIHWSN